MGRALNVRMHQFTLTQKEDEASERPSPFTPAISFSWHAVRRVKKGGLSIQPYSQ